MRSETVHSDITVIGGGLSGVCAAVAAARLGSKVALVQNRPVLGGNSSSEIRVWVCGATGHGVNRYSRETGIMGEMFLENQYTNPEGNPYYWDIIVLETVRNEPNIQLFLNTDVHEVETDTDGEDQKIRSVTGWMMGSERRIRFESPVFLDCSGDGLIGFLAGAKFQLGREAKHEYNEAWGQEVADDIQLGSTLLFYTKDVGFPVKYVAPSFAKDITQTPIPMQRVIQSGDSGCFYWWIEFGGEMDIAHDNESIRDELQSVIYGIWDYIKNSGNYQADNLTLEWVGNLPGKREYRRFIGDYVYNQNDIEGQVEFEDRVTFGGWSIDLHDPKGMYGEVGSKHLQPKGIYHIPFRSLYSVNVPNLLFAGRNFSATHVAFGGTRVQGTCATMGEAAGTAASLCVLKGVSPRELHRSHLQELQMTLLRQDASMIGLSLPIEGNLAPLAKVSASSTMDVIASERPDQAFKLHTDLGFTFPVDPSLGTIELLLDVDAPTVLEVEVWDTGRGENYIPATLQTRDEIRLEPGTGKWATFLLPWEPGRPQNAFVIIKENPLVSVHLSTQPVSGVLTYVREKGLNVERGIEGLDPNEPVVMWNMKSVLRKVICFRAATAAYSPDKTTDGFLRPYAGPHMWASQPMQPGGNEWLEFAWDSEVTVQEIQLVLNDDVNEDLINLHHHRTPFEIMPQLVKDFSIQVKEVDAWTEIYRESGNRRRMVKCQVPAVQATQLRIVVESTNGGERAEVSEVRIF
ncbi:FAD-dependent oxidoreductase [Paenibacillus thalictri]|uniref:FAD-dependent oxidoreductase n=1 Tax=Paenibacillus thalictri TaxID=2527873 RepID=A0A4Q9DQK4_9BACL|nr:FAD-dependent oxidoreductase [Paenibacillus thalictri]TBL77662.1 FAD-dependent oxidoreductase [Paenibacillus thalictri]